MSAGKLASVLIQKSFTTQRKTPNCTESTNASLVLLRGCHHLPFLRYCCRTLRDHRYLWRKVSIWAKSRCCSKYGVFRFITRGTLAVEPHCCPLPLDRKTIQSCITENNLGFNIFLKGVWTCRLQGRASNTAPSIAPRF